MSTRQESNWVSLSDLMTGLMLVFLLISILTISHVAKQQEKRSEMVRQYEVATSDIYQDLKSTFNGKEEEWGLEISPDLSITFQNPEVLFDYRSAEITPHFRTILDEFIPLYLSIINKPQYADTIKEVRIEGHTAEWDDYSYTIELSQERSNAVLAYILTSKSYAELTQKEQETIKFWLISAGFGNGRTLDANGNYTNKTGKKTAVASRRVEFRIVTTSDELVQDIINNS